MQILVFKNKIFFENNILYLKLSANIFSVNERILVRLIWLIETLNIDFNIKAVKI